METNFKIII